MIPFWVWWLGWGTLVLGTFAPLEGYYLRHKDRGHTLSWCVAWLGTRFPLSIWIGGAVCGGLAVHFFWHFCPVLADTAQPLSYVLQWSTY